MNSGMIQANSKDLLAWSRGQALWTYSLNISCCGLEFAAATSPRYDWERFGAMVQTDPRNADLLIVAGPLTEAIRKDVLDVYSKLLAPKFVISMGSCANTGGIFAGYSPVVKGGIDEILPVDVYVPGCPPRPEALIHGLLSLQERVVRGEVRK
jgi:NADH-quinone oxidoreductase subunit B